MLLAVAKPRIVPRACVCPMLGLDALGMGTLAQPGMIEDLLARVAQGDRAAFGALYQATSARLFAIVLRILGDRDTAEDVLQDVYVRVWRRSGSFDPARGAPMAWLGRIARNAALDALAARRSDDELEAADRIEFAVAAVDPPDARLGQCLKRIPADQARAICQAYVYGLSHAELARQLDAPLGTVKSWITRGMAALRKCMET